MLKAWTERRRVVLLALLILMWLIPLGRPLIDQADSVGYIAPALSIVDDGDLLYLNEYRELAMSPRYFRLTPEGLVENTGTSELRLCTLRPSA